MLTATGSTGVPKVLVVEDELQMASLIRHGLLKEGLSVDVAASGEDSLWMVGAVDYDAIVLDVMLPGINGFETCRQIRGKGVRAPVLMLTARDSVEDRVAGLDSGADDYLVKPFAFAELLVRVKALLRRGASPRPNVLRVGDLEVDRLTQQVRRAGKRIELTSKEYGLLEYLAANAGRVLSRTMIIEHVWDESFEGLTNIVDVYVRHLRSKVDVMHATKLIRTVRGVGYSVSDEPEPGI